MSSAPCRRLPKCITYSTKEEGCYTQCRGVARRLERWLEGSGLWSASGRHHRAAEPVGVLVRAQPVVCRPLRVALRRSDRPREGGAARLAVRTMSPQKVSPLASNESEPRQTLSVTSESS